MVHDAVAHLPRQVEPVALVLEVVDDPQTLLVVPERPAEEGRQRLLAEMSERRVTQIVTERDRFGEILVQAECPRRGARDLRHLERVSEPHAVVVSLGHQEHLRLVLQPPERFRVHDPVAVPLETGPQWIRLLLALASFDDGGQGRVG